MRVATVAALLLPVALAAQSAKKPLTQDTYDLWRSIQQPTLSADGRWAVYTLSPTVGDGELVARATSGSTEYRVPRGATGRPLQTVNGSPFSAQPARISGDSRFVVFLQYPTQAALDSARNRRGRNAQQPRNAMAILSLIDGQVQTVERVRGFSLPRDGRRFVAYQLDADSAAAGAGAGARGGAAAAAGAAARADSGSRAARRKDTGYTLVLRELATTSAIEIEHVTDYALHDSERWLAYAVAGPDSLGIDGVFIRELATGTVTPLKQGTGNYRNLTFDETGTQLAFITDADDWGKDTVRFALYHAPLTAARDRAAPRAATRIVAQEQMPEGMMLAERSRLSFVKTGAVLGFGIAQIPPDSIPADSLRDKADVEIWHWRDTRTVPMQKLQANADRNRQYTAVYHVAARRMLPLGNEEFPSINLSTDGRVAVANTNVPYQLDALAGEGGTDIHVVNTLTGEFRQVATKVQGGGQLSDGGKYVVWWENQHWQLHDIAANRTRTVTADIPNVSFARETHDTPTEPRPWGVGGWTADDRHLLLYDRYDIWEIDPSGTRPARNLTDGVGRREKLTFRLVQLDPDAEFFDPAQPLLLRTFNNITKDEGLYRDRVAAASAPERILMAPKSWPVLQKARNAEQYLVAREDHHEYPNLWTGSSFTQLQQISNAMPEQSQYLWGDVQLTHWLNSDGVPMEGLLYTPEGFDRTKQYPMLVYFYEQLSDNLHNYTRPSGRNLINPIVYTSLGYVVFMPNIHYTEGYPGPSAVKSVVPGVQHLIAQGFVDPKRIGIGGQSWGGYQTNYIITQTQLFAAAVPNATVVNMTSAYGGIRWGSGVERAIVNYERGQSRIGGSLWEYPERYIENSPLFFLDRVTTPVLFMANDNDGAVPWYQGIEFFVAMRRLGKEAYMVNYVGDEHNPRRWANQKDIDRRMQEFFAAKLLGAPAPEWMTNGVPYLERGREQMERR